MGIKRSLWRSTSIGRAIDTATNSAKEGSLAKGFKKTADEDIEDIKGLFKTAAKPYNKAIKSAKSKK